MDNNTFNNKPVNTTIPNLQPMPDSRMQSNPQMVPDAQSTPNSQMTSGQQIMPSSQMSDCQDSVPQPPYGQPTRTFEQPNYAGVSNNPTPSADKKKKYILIGGIAAVCAVAIVAIIIAVRAIGGSSASVPMVNAARTLSCTVRHDATGIRVDESFVFKIDNGTIKQMVYTLTTDLANSDLSFSGGSEEDWVRERVSTNENDCAANNCTYVHEYDNGKTLKEIFSYNEQGANSWAGGDVSKYTADEIVEKLSDGLGIEGYQCQ